MKRRGGAGGQKRRVPSGLWPFLLSLWLMPVCAGVPLDGQSTAFVDNSLSSLNSDNTAYITFYNNLSFDLDLYWINFSGVRVYYATIAAGTSHAQPTFMTHPWLLVRTGSGGSTVQGTGQLVAAFLPATASAGSPSEGDTATIGVGGDLTTSVLPTSLTFNSRSNGPIQRQHLEIGALRPGQPFTISTSGSWLKAIPNSGVTPALVVMEADPTGLPPNAVYPGTVFVTAPGGSPSQTSVPATFGVGNALPAQLVANPRQLKIPIFGAAGSGTGCLTLENAGSGSIGPLFFGVETRDPVAFAVGTTTVTITPAEPRAVVCVMARTNDPATHTGNLIIQMAGQSVLTVPMVQQTHPPRLAVYPSSVFIGGFPPDPPGSSFPVQHTIVRPLTLSRQGLGVASYRSMGIPGWVTANPPTGTFTSDSLPLNLELKFGSVAAGGYQGKLTIDDGVTNLYGTSVSVVMEASNAPPKAVDMKSMGAQVLTPGQNQSTVFELSANSLVERPVQITADYGKAPAFFTFARLPTVHPASGLGPRYPVRVTLSNPIPPPGFYQGFLVLTYNSHVFRTQVLAVIPPGAGQSATRKAEACVPARMVAAPRAPLEGFGVQTGWPTEISVAVVDDCGNADNAGNVLASFSNGDPTVTLVKQPDGTWGGTWVGQNASDNVEVTVTSVSKDGKLTASASVLGALTLNPLNPPLVFDGGVVNGASFALEGMLSPGSFVSVFGKGLADGQLNAPSVPLPDTLAGASVEIGGVSAPVFFASDGQLNAIVPYGLPANAPLEVIVRRGDAFSVARSVPIAPAAPGIFSYGDQLGIIVGVAADGTQALANSTSPVTAQQAIVAYVTGLGEVSPAVKAGTQTPLTVLSRTVAPVTMTIGGIPARVDFAGLTPGSTGLYQINAEVPAGIAPGDRVPVVIEAAGQSSAPAYISVR